MKFTIGFVCGLVLASVGAFAQSLFPDIIQQQNQSFQNQLSPNQQEFNAQSYSTMRDGGIGYQKSFQQRNPC